jgi:hypothetical protein
MLRKTFLVGLLTVLLGAAPPTNPIPAKPNSTQPTDVADSLEFASAICLAEVTSVTTEDHRGGDGPLEDVIKLKILKSSGNASPQLAIKLTDSGMHPPPEWEPHGPLFPDPLKANQRYWFVFDASRNFQKYPQGVIAWWPEDAAPTKILEDVITMDRFAWHPTYDPETSRFYGYRVDDAKGEWSARVWTKDKILWERKFTSKFDPGAYESWILHGRKDWDPFVRADANDSNKFLSTSAKCALAKDNPFSLPPGVYTVFSGLDFDTGKTAVTIVNNPSPGLSRIELQLSLKTGKVREETRELLMDTGGLAVGATTERWMRTTIRQFDDDGKQTSEQNYRGTGRNKVLLKLSP